jgi:DNA-binding MarR family transcriptional regulator
LTTRLNQTLDKLLVRRHDVMLSELFALVALREGAPRGMRIQDLADQLGLDQSSVSRLTARLQSRGLTERVRCEYDRRGVYCAITDAGRTLATEADQTFRSALTEALDKAQFEESAAVVVVRLRHASQPGTRLALTTEEGP